MEKIRNRAVILHFWPRLWFKVQQINIFCKKNTIRQTRIICEGRPSHDTMTKNRHPKLFVVIKKLLFVSAFHPVRIRIKKKNNTTFLSYSLHHALNHWNRKSKDIARLWSQMILYESWIHPWNQGNKFNVILCIANSGQNNYASSVSKLMWRSDRDGRKLKVHDQQMSSYVS